MKNYFQVTTLIIFTGLLPSFITANTIEQSSSSNTAKTQPPLPEKVSKLPPKSPAKDSNPNSKLETAAALKKSQAEIQSLRQQLEMFRLENSKLTLQNLIKTERYEMALEKLEQEKEQLLLENELQSEKNRQALSQLMAEKEKLLLENEIQAARQAQTVADLEALKNRLELKNQINEQKQKLLLTEMEKEHSKIALKNALQEEKNKQQELVIQTETARLTLEMAKLEFEKAKKTARLEELTEKIAKREQEEIWESQVNEPQPYLNEPFKEGELIISDRRIELDTVIIPGISEYVIERIHYYNNKSTEYPIFLVIDRCYGGSVMEGAKIVEAMEDSQAPIYVVVKSFAASMAAVITAFADRSYAYPHAIIIHHQMISFAFGNKKQLEEQLQVAEEWTERIMKPIADKMGITMEAFVEGMYKKSSTGNWREFADEAVKLKWIDAIADRIQDTSYSKKPLEEEEEISEEDGTLLSSEYLHEKIDQHEQPYLKLPHLGALDLYFLYNPDNYYRY